MEDVVYTVDLRRDLNEALELIAQLQDENKDLAAKQDEGEHRVHSLQQVCLSERVQRR